MRRATGRPVIAVLLLLTAVSTVLGVNRANHAAAATSPLSNGSTTMVSTLANGTSVPTNPALAGANEIAISDDGKVIAFTSAVPAEELVTDPTQTGHVTDNNTGFASGGISAGLDVFVYDSRVPSPLGPIISLVSWNSSKTGTGNAPSDNPVMAPLGVGLVFRSSATDLVTGSVGASQQHLYAWVPLLSPLTSVFLIDNKYGTHDACDCVSQNPSISLLPIPTVVFHSTGTDLVPPGFPLHGDQVFATNIVLGTTSVVSIDVNGEGVVGGADEPMIAANAPVVVFRSTGNDLTPGFVSGGSNIWVRNLLTSTTTLVSTSATGSPGGTSGNHNPVISRLGNGVAWSSNDPDVTTTPFFNPGQTTDHIFYRSVLPMGTTQMVDTGATGLLGCNDHSNNAGISGDGLVVVFESNCTDIVASPLVDTNSSTDVFIRHMLFDGAPQLVSINDAHTGTGQSGSMLCGPGGGSFATACASLTNPSVTVNFDGTAVAFFSNANDVATVPNPPVSQGGTSSHFVDGNIIVGYPSLLSTKTVNASVSITDENPQGTSGTPVISSDGGSVAFVSFADDLVNGDVNGTGDVFVKDIHNSFVIQPIVPVHEGDGHVTIALHRTGTNGTTDTVSYATADGSTPALPLLPPEITNPGNSNATQPSDYTETSGSLVFPPGIDTLTFDVPITNDNVIEDPEVFHVSISAAGGAASVALPGPLSAAYVVILDDDAPQDWHVNISTPPPSSAQVGDTVSVGYTLSVDAGADDLTVSSVSAGAGTSGLDSASFPSPPTTVAAGTTSAESTATARVVAVPGSPGVHLQLSVDGSLGATASTKTAETSTIAVGEAVTATLAQTLATPGLADQITYTLTVTNGSDTDAQLSGLPAGFVAPAGTTQASRTDGSTTVAANSDSVWTLTVDVDDTDADATTITETPSGLLYAMSAVSLAARPIAVTPSSVTATVAAAVVEVSAHTLVDVNGGTLDPGDAVNVSVTVANSGGAAATTATLSDALTELASPANVQIDGAACGACSTTASSVTAPLGTIASASSHVVTFTATIPASPGGPIASSSATVTFEPATTGTSPTAASVASLTIGGLNLQDWHIAITQQPPPLAEVGDTVTVKATISVDAGADSLSVATLASGAATAGLDTIVFADATPFTVNAGASKEVTVTARLTGTPGSSTNLLDVSVTGALGAAPSATKDAATNALTSNEAVSATLAQDTATPGLGDQITYTVMFTNHSDSAATLSGVTLPTPTGATNPVAVDGTSTVAPGGSSTFTLTVDVAAADADGLHITETPAALYAMASPPVASRAVTFTPATVTATVQAPVVSVSAHTLVDVNGGTLDPGDAVNVSVTVANSGGAAATTATLSDALTELASPANVQIDGAACGACSTTASSVTAPLGTIASASSHVVTFTATIPASPGGPTASSSATVTFAPATTGTSPTVADVRTLTIGAAVPPVAANDSYATDEDVALTVAAPGVLGNDSGSGQLHAAVDSTAAAHGTVTLAQDGAFTYTPDANFNGTASFTYVANDGTSDSNVATVTITVHAVNDAPTIVDGTVTVTAGGAVDIDLNAFASDVDGDLLAFTVVTLPVHGTLSCAPTGHCTYTPADGFVGDDSFQFTATDGLAFMVVGASTYAADAVPVGTVRLTVVAPSGGGSTTTSTPPTGSLPVTGDRTSRPFSLAGALSMLLGFAFITVARRRSRNPTP